jgi:hypothetical protein
MKTEERESKQALEDAPNYQQGEGDRRCETCAHAVGEYGVLICSLYRFASQLDAVCDSWEIITVDLEGEKDSITKPIQKDRARIEQRSTDFVVPTSMLPTWESAIALVPPMGVPSTEQLARINEFRPVGADELTADQLVLIPFIASHNLLSYSNGVWDAESLAAMVSDFPGEPLEVDHEWEEVGAIQAFICEAQIVRSVDAPYSILGAVPNSEINQAIVRRDGFIAVVLVAAISAEAAIVDAIKYRRVHDVSTGGITSGQYWCPDCNLDFNDELCPHLIPFNVSGYVWEQCKKQGYNFARYYIRKGFSTAIELSCVVKGNLPGAGTIDYRIMKTIAQ